MYTFTLALLYSEWGEAQSGTILLCRANEVVVADMRCAVKGTFLLKRYYPNAIENWKKLFKQSSQSKKSLCTHLLSD